MSDTQELAFRRLQCKEYEALLAYLCDISGVQAHTWYRVQPEQSHPEDDRRIMVETGANGSGEYVMVRFGFDSDVAKLVDWINELHSTVGVDDA